MKTQRWFMGAVVVLVLMLFSPPAAALAGPQTATVPLTIVPIGGGQLKIGIELRLGGGPRRLYTFDTGSSGFYAAYNPLWWPVFDPVPAPTIEQSYGSGLTFQAEQVRTTVGIPTTVGEVEAEVEVAKITDASGTSFGPSGESSWADDVAAGRPPLYGRFFGDFGSGLREQNGLFAVLPQLTGNLSSGFAVQLGCSAFGPSLVIGLTRAIRSRVTSWITMRAVRQSPPFPNSNRPTYAQKLFAARFLLRGNGASYSFRTGAILDTGGPTTNIHQHGKLMLPDALLTSPEVPTQVIPGARFRVTAEGTELLDLRTGRTLGVNQVAVTQSSGKAAYVNLGLVPFFQYDVVFDIQRGLVGFAPPCSLPNSARLYPQRPVHERVPTNPNLPRTVRKH